MFIALEEEQSEQNEILEHASVDVDVEMMQSENENESRMHENKNGMNQNGSGEQMSKKESSQRMKTRQMTLNQSISDGGKVGEKAPKGSEKRDDQIK